MIQFDKVKFRTGEKNIKYLNRREKVEKNTQLSFWWKGKSSSYEFAFEDFIFNVGSATNSVGTTFELAAFGSGPDAKYSRASTFCFFSVQNHGQPREALLLALTDYIYYASLKFSCARDFRYKLCKLLSSSS